MLMLSVACVQTPDRDVPMREYAGAAVPSREVCVQPRRACTGFVDTISGEAALGADDGAAAADALRCADIVKGHATRCPNNRDSRSQAYLCPELVRGPEFPGQQVFCGPCRSSRAEMLAFGIKALVDAASLDELSGCAGAGRCEGWHRCLEAGTGRMKASDWTADFLGWSLAPERGLLTLDRSGDPGAAVECRPHDAATWPEAVMFFAKLSGLTGNLRCN
ncbi:MAG TPA: hypothetical protein VGB85_05505, partial [Nannocystis sp.]